MASSTAARKPSPKRPARRANAPKASAPKAEAPKVTQVADPVTDMLARYGFAYDLVTLNLSEIDRKQSETNQARIAKPIDDDQVAIYAEQMDAGDKFPPIVCYKARQGYIVMDGNHRVAASDIADIPTIQAYVVRDPSPAQVQAFTFEANTKHGLPTSLQDRQRQAIFLHEQGLSLREAASRLGINANQLAHALNVYQAETRFQRLGIKKFDALNTSAKTKLDAIHSDVVLKAVADLALEARLSSGDLGKLVRDINAIRTSERDQLKAVHVARESRAATIKATAGGRIPVAVNLTTLARAVTTINRLDPGRLETHLLGLPTEARTEYGRAASAAVTRLMDVIRVIQRASQPE